MAGELPDVELEKLSVGNEESDTGSVVKPPGKGEPVKGVGLNRAVSASTPALLDASRETRPTQGSLIGVSVVGGSVSVSISIGSADNDTSEKQASQSAIGKNTKTCFHAFRRKAASIAGGGI